MLVKIPIQFLLLFAVKIQNPQKTTTKPTTIKYKTLENQFLQGFCLFSCGAGGK
jgi:hypothetical protein